MLSRKEFEAFVKQNFVNVRVTDDALRLLRITARDNLRGGDLPEFLTEALQALQQLEASIIDGIHVKAWKVTTFPPTEPRATEEVPPTIVVAPEPAVVVAPELAVAVAPEETTSPSSVEAGSAPSGDLSAADTTGYDSDVVWIPGPATHVAIAPSPGQGDSSDSEVEWQPTGSLAAAPTYDVREILDSYMRRGRRVYLTDWESTEEPPENLPPRMMAAFHRRRRSLVRRAFIEDEARGGRTQALPSTLRPRRPLRRLRRAVDA